MAIQQVATISINLQGDGSSTAFAFGLNKLSSIGTVGSALANFNTIPVGANFHNESSPISAVATVDAFGNLTITFSSAPANGQQITCWVDLFFNTSGSLSGTSASWNSSTSANTVLALPVTAMGAVLLSMNVIGVLSSGQLNFEISDNGTNWYNALGFIQGSFTVFTNWQPSFGSAVALQFNVAGFNQFRVRVQTTLSGTGSVTIQLSASPQVINPMSAVVQQFGPNLHHVLDDATGNFTATITSAGALKVDGSAVTQPVNLSSVAGAATITAASGVQMVGVVGSTGATLDSAIGTLPTNNGADITVPSTGAGAAVLAKSLSVTTSQNVKASTGNIYGLYALNGAASTAWVQFVNSAGAGTLGTTSLFSVPIPASITQPVWIPLPYPVNASTGIAVGASTTNNGATAVSTAVAITVFYK